MTRSFSGSALYRTETGHAVPDRAISQMSPCSLVRLNTLAGDKRRAERKSLVSPTNQTPMPLIGRPSPKGDPKIAQYLPLARSYARKYAGELIGHTFDDLLSIAMEALWRATERWVPERGANFVTFAGHVITHAFWNEAKKARRQRRIPLRAFVSTTRDEDEEMPIHLVSSEPGPDELLEARRRPVLEAALRSLKRREREVITGLYYADQTFSEVGEQLGFTRQRAQQIEGKALERMRRVVGRRAR